MLYTPTWRPYQYGLPIKQLEGFDQNRLEKFLIENSIIILYSLHSKQDDELFDGISNVVFLNRDENPFQDLNEIMIETDLLISDYCSTSTDFLILDRPQVFVMPDLDKFSKENGFIDDYVAMLPGDHARDFDELLDQITKNLFNEIEHKNRYYHKRKVFLDKYYDSDKGDSSAKFAAFIDSELKGKQNNIEI